MYIRYLKKYPFEIISILLFTIYFPLINLIDFAQNDDWAFYESTRAYMNFDFSVNPLVLFGKSSVLFYTQGILGAAYSYIISLEKLPILTLVISISNFYLLSIIFSKYFSYKNIDAILISLVLFFNPLYQYAILGYMTENYSVFCMLISMLFIFKFKNTNKYIDFIFANLFIILGFFVKQFSLIVSIYFGFELLSQKRYKLLIVQVLITSIIGVFYKLFFLNNYEKTESGFMVANLINPEYIFTILIAISIYLIITLLPILVSFFNKLNIESRLKWGGIIIFIILLELAVFEYFRANLLSHAEFPFFENTYTRQGFFSENFQSYKPNFYGMYDFYKYTELISKFLIWILPVGIIMNYKNLSKPLLAFLGCFILLLLSINFIFDRYLIFLFFVLALLVGSLKLRLSYPIRAIFILQIVFFSFVAYQFCIDFVLANKYVWNRGMELVERDSVDPKLINAGSAWRKANDNRYTKWNYIFTYNNPAVMSKDYQNATLIESKQVYFPLSFYTKNEIYLYKISD